MSHFYSHKSQITQKINLLITKKLRLFLKISGWIKTPKMKPNKITQINKIIK